MHVPCQVLCQYELIYLHISPLNHHITSEETEAWGGVVSNLHQGQEQAKLEFNAG